MGNRRYYKLVHSNNEMNQQTHVCALKQGQKKHSQVNDNEGRQWSGQISSLDVIEGLLT
jgi:hypothetical protein